MNRNRLTGRCGADITAQEKFKKLKNGEFNRHVYYNCTRRVDPHCKEKYINETDLCVLLQEFMEANYKKIHISDKLRARVEKHYGVTKTLFEHYKIETKAEWDEGMQLLERIAQGGTPQEQEVLRQVKLVLKQTALAKNALKSEFLPDENDDLVD